MRRLTLCVIVAAGIATGGCGSNGSSGVALNPFPPVPEIRGLSRQDAFERLEHAGWRQYEPGTGYGEIVGQARYDTYSATGGVVGPRRRDEFRVVCGGRLDRYYLLAVRLARRRSECRPLAREVRPVPRIVLVDRRQRPAQYWAIWGRATKSADGVYFYPVFQTYPPVAGGAGGDDPDVLIAPGTCARPAPTRAYHGGGFELATLRATTWSLRWGKRCLTHRGARVLPSDASPLPDRVRTRRIVGGRLVVDGPDGKVIVDKLGPRRTRITARMYTNDSSSGAGVDKVHLRPGTCSQIGAPEFSLTTPGLGAVTVVPIPFEQLAHTPHVVESHSSNIGDEVVGCVRLDGPSK